MEFKGQYLTYSDYKLFGGTLDIMPFNLLELDARMKVNARTLDRLVGTTDIPQEVKLCMFKLVEGMAFDGLYKDREAEQKEQYVEEIIYNTLVSVVYNGTPLLYCGI